MEFEPWTPTNQFARVFDIFPFDDGSGPTLFFGGSFHALGGQPMGRIAKWLSCSPDIFADGFETGDTSAWTSTSP